MRLGLLSGSYKFMYKGSVKQNLWICIMQIYRILKAN